MFAKLLSTETMVMDDSIDVVKENVSHIWWMWVSILFSIKWCKPSSLLKTEADFESALLFHISF